MESPKQNVDVEFKAAGLGKLKTEWLDFAGDLLAPVAILAAGGSKVQAAWMGVSGVFMTRVLGPLGMVAGAATGFLLVTRKLVKEWSTVGVQSAKAIETLTLQFKPLLGSMELAKKRAREVFAFSVKSPFKFDELAAGNKVLESLTRGALSGKAGMTLVGDAAAVAGAGFEETARSVGRLYDGISSGRPVGEASQRLQELGLITGQTRNQIETMQAANASGSQIWAMVQQDIQRTKGAMDDLMSSLAGLESTYEDTRTQLQAGFGAGFMEGEKTGITSATQVMERMTPVAKALGDVIGPVSNGFAAMKARVVDAATGFPGFTSVVTGAFWAVTGLAAAIVLATGAIIGKFAVGILSAAQGGAQLAASIGSVTAAEAVGTVVSGSLAEAKAALLAVVAALKAGNYAEAASHLKVAAAETLVAIRTNGLAASQALLRGGLKLTVKALGFVVSSMVELGGAMLGSPAFLLSAAFVAAGATMMYFYNHEKKVREELDAMAAAAQATVSNLRQQALAIRTVADLRKAEADAVMKLVEAHKELAAAKGGGKDNYEAVHIAKKKVRDVATVMEDIRGKSGSVEKSDEELAREDAAEAREKEARKAREDDAGGRGESSALAVAKARKKEGDRLREKALASEAAEKAIKADQDKGRRDVEDHSMEQGVLEEQRDKLMKRKSELQKSGSGKTEARQKNKEELAGVNEKLEAMKALKAAEETRVSNIALQSDSELLRLQEKIKIYGELKLAKSEYETADNNKKSDAPAFEEAKKRKDAAERAALGAGLGDRTNLENQDDVRRVAKIQAQREADKDPVAAGERDRAVRDAELGLAQTRIDAEKQVAGLRLKGYEQEKAILEMERLALATAHSMGKLDDESFAKESRILDARQESMEKNAADKKGELTTAVQIATLQRREGAARGEGDIERADALRSASDALADERTRKDANKEADDMGVDEGGRKKHVAGRLSEEQAGRFEERRKAGIEQRLGQDRARANEGSAVAGINARVAELQGNDRLARRIKEKSAREQDEVDRREKMKGYREQGFTGEDADAMANRAVKMQQADRQMQGMGSGQKGWVVASSLAQVGGGGNVAGQDPNTRLQERMVLLLTELNDTTKKNVTDTMR